MPVYHGPLLVPDEDEVALQGVADVFCRIAVLWAVALRGEGVSREEALSMIDEQDLWSVLSEKERSFLLDDAPSDTDSLQSVWRLESIWVLLWSLGYVDELLWPDQQCDVPKLVEIIEKIEDEPDHCRPTQLRSTSELLDERDLLMRLMWAIRDAYLHKDCMVPVDLNWASGSDFLPVPICEGVQVVSERFQTIVWLTDAIESSDWDDVDVST